MPFPPRTPFEWKLRTRTVQLGRRTLLMGILNVTPDSFSNGGRSFALETSVARGLKLLDDGADILDIGGESTRPGATPLAEEEEQVRVLPVLAALLREWPTAVVSVDTYHAGTARHAVEAGAEIVNDVSGLLWDAEMAATCAELGCGLVLTHTRGRPAEWATLPPMPTAAVMPVVLTGLRDSILAARSAGVTSDRIVIDPGFGFGKRGTENYVVHSMLDRLRQFGLPVLAGSSRKGFLRALFNKDRALAPDSEESVRASAASAVAAVLAGAHIVRTHDVRETARAVAVGDAILEAAAAVEASIPLFSTASSSKPQ